MTGKKKTIIRLRYARQDDFPLPWESEVRDVRSIGSRKSTEASGIDCAVWEPHTSTIHRLTFRDYEIWRLNIQRPADFILLDSVWVRADSFLQALDEKGILQRVGGPKVSPKGLPEPPAAARHSFN